MMVKYLHFPNEYVSWGVGSGIILFIYLWQKWEREG
jgi:hypothetical protein